MRRVVQWLPLMVHLRSVRAAFLFCGFWVRMMCFGNDCVLLVFWADGLCLGQSYCVLCFCGWMSCFGFLALMKFDVDILFLCYKVFLDFRVSGVCSCTRRFLILCLSVWFFVVFVGDDGFRLCFVVFGLCLWLGWQVKSG